MAEQTLAELRAEIFGRMTTMAEVNAQPRAVAKHEIVPRQLTKDAKKKAKKLTDDQFRALIWKLDGGKSRATGKPLVHGGTTDWQQLGEVDHSIPRSLAPDRIYDPTNALLLSKWENRARKIPCPRAPEFRMFDYTGPDDRRQKQTFIWRDEDGKITKRRIG